MDATSELREPDQAVVPAQADGEAVAPPTFIVLGGSSSEVCEPNGDCG
ncbi:MAG: hypothetical protein ACK5H2_12640 [Beutenbergiaceae bacterium]